MSNLSTIKAAFVDLMNARTVIATSGVTVGYGAPLHADDVTASDGDLQAVWLSDATARIEVPYLGSAVRHELLTFDVVHQAIERGRTNDGQQVADESAEALLTESMNLLASDPDLSLTTVEPLACIAEGWTYLQLPRGANAWGARYTLTVSTQPAGIAAP